MTTRLKRAIRRESQTISMNRRASNAIGFIAGVVVWVWFFLLCFTTCTDALGCH